MFQYSTINAGTLELLKSLMQKQYLAGGACLENAEKLYKTGVDILVAGNAVFNTNDPIQAIKDIRNKAK